METVPRLEVLTDCDAHLPGTTLSGQLNVVSSSSVSADAIQARFVGKAIIDFVDENKVHYMNEQRIVDETKELWRFVSLSEMLGLPEENDSDTGSFAQKAQFSMVFHIPENAPTSLAVAGFPARIKYQIEIRILRGDSVCQYLEHQVAVVQPFCVPRPINQSKIVHSKKFHLASGRSVFLECSLGKAVYRSADEIQAEITVTNNWKESLKYVRLFIVGIMECEGTSSFGTNLKKTFRVHHNGVGLPSDIPKIPVGQSASFSPVYYVPALYPDVTMPGFLRVSHALCMEAGRSHSFVLGRLQIPITIVTDIVDVVRKSPPSEIPKEDLLIDLSRTPSWKKSSDPPVMDLLA